MTSYYVVMGVSGSGKTTIGEALAAQLGVPFYDGDDYHPPENIAKMAQGEPLNDEDRHPWLQNLNQLIRVHIDKEAGIVVACSALKRSYREQLAVGNNEVAFVFLQGSFDLIWQRMLSRTDHYMKADMLHSQFVSLEEPADCEAIKIDIAHGVQEIVETVLAVA